MVVLMHHIFVQNDVQRTFCKINENNFTQIHVCDMHLGYDNNHNINFL